jgi:hypothetical protein
MVTSALRNQQGFVVLFCGYLESKWRTDWFVGLHIGVRFFGFATIEKNMHQDNQNLKTTYLYRFSNGDGGHMTPVEAHKYAHRHKVEIWEGPNYSEGKPRERFTGWGYHYGLRMVFRGPAHYREYLKANNLIEAGNEKAPLWEEPVKPIWTERLIRKAINEYGMDIGSVMAEALLSGELDFPEGPVSESTDEGPGFSDDAFDMENMDLNTVVAN